MYKSTNVRSILDKNKRSFYFTSVKFAKGRKTKHEILGRAANVASGEGLEGLTIGKLASKTNLSKSGLFSHFGSKEELQRETVLHASDVFVAEIVAPVESVSAGIDRLVALIDRWISYVSGSVFEGGCFFYSVSAEVDDRPGPIRDLVADLTMSWVHILEAEIGCAIRQRELESEIDVELLVFRIHGAVQEANWFHRLHRKKDAFRTARKSIVRDLRQAGAGEAELELLYERTETT